MQNTIRQHVQHVFLDSTSSADWLSNWPPDDRSVVTRLHNCYQYWSYELYLSCGLSYNYEILHSEAE